MLCASLPLGSHPSHSLSWYPFIVLSRFNPLPPDTAQLQQFTRRREAIHLFIALYSHRLSPLHSLALSCFLRFRLQVHPPQCRVRPSRFPYRTFSDDDHEQTRNTPMRIIFINNSNKSIPMTSEVDYWRMGSHASGIFNHRNLIQSRTRSTIIPIRLSNRVTSFSRLLSFHCPRSMTWLPRRRIRSLHHSSSHPRNISILRVHIPHQRWDHAYRPRCMAATAMATVAVVGWIISWVGSCRRHVVTSTNTIGIRRIFKMSHSRRQSIAMHRHRRHSMGDTMCRSSMSHQSIPPHRTPSSARTRHQ